MQNVDFIKYEKLKQELYQIQNYCPHQYFAVEKCTGKVKDAQGNDVGCGRLHVDRYMYPCIHYFTGNCKYGMNCHFSHHIKRQIIRPAPNADTCRKLYYENTCPQGGKCKFSHDLKSYPCEHNTVGKCRFSDEDCRYSHEKLIESPVVCFFDLMKGCKNKPEDCPNTHISDHVTKHLSYTGPLI